MFKMMMMMVRRRIVVVVVLVLLLLLLLLMRMIFFVEKDGNKNATGRRLKCLPVAGESFLLVCPA